MYLPPVFREDQIGLLHDLIRTHPLATLVTAGPGGLMANLIPFLFYPDEGEHGTLRAHLSRGNPQWKELAQADECMVVFQGANGYITPSWYQTKKETGKVVPTWNFVTVHAWGTPCMQEDPAWLSSHLHDLTYSQEHARVPPWKIEDAPADFIATQMKAIIGLEIAVGRMEGKWKVSQNRPQVDRLGVVEGLRAQGEPSRVMADLVAQRAKDA
ncbi:FMN-binding negative transcriptional regulator [Paralcaligenes ureilyticus]|uniref:PaiB family negative transcriptional regulator n=1 Tax=Paralcaligenes ureilyticus TaxID=627131 RepID=A0A4R3M6U7_9BURK|nr:FMN-binding negative transcriptional regulator [Paralcaligenes ureilyticus]TCT07005.1 PaiB family negative transcriptional regulator [Paralcaligenes ureilyticus]